MVVEAADDIGLHKCPVDTTISSGVNATTNARNFNKRNEKDKMHIMGKIMDKLPNITSSLSILLNATIRGVSE